MNQSDKFIKKTVPRLVAALVAVVMGLALFVFNRYVIYKPDSKKNNDINFVVDTTAGEGGDIGDITFSDTSFNFLVMGHDRIASLTDVILIINYNTEKQQVTMMQFPRDTYFRIDDYYYHKINGLYNYCISAAEAEGAKDPEHEGLLKTAEYFEKNLAIKIHYSAVMDLDGFEGIVEAIGGVDMYVPMRMYYPDPGQNLLIDLQEGWQHLDGNAAEQFVRYRYGYVTGDYGRQDAQKLFISAFIDKLKSSITDASTVTSLAKNVVTYVDTDITDADIVYFGKCFLGIGKSDSVDMKNIKMFTMPGSDAMWEGASMYCMNKEYTAEIMNEYFNIYDFDITGSFDRDGVFVTPYETVLTPIYYSDKEYAYFSEYDANTLREDGLN